MNKIALLTALSLAGALPPAGASTAINTQMDAWADKHLPDIEKAARELLAPPFTPFELWALAQEAVQAAQELSGFLNGASRAKIAQVLLVTGVRIVTPDAMEPWIIPFLEGQGLEAIIESAFLKVFPEKAAPVTDQQPLGLDPRGDDALGRPATDADFAPSFNDQPLEK